MRLKLLMSDLPSLKLPLLGVQIARCQSWFKVTLDPGPSQPAVDEFEEKETVNEVGIKERDKVRKVVSAK